MNDRKIVQGSSKMKIFLIFLLTTATLAVNSQDIAQWRGPERSGVYSEAGLLRKWPVNGPEMLWHYDVLGDGFTSAAVTSRGVFTTGMIGSEGFVFALNMNGRLLWKKAYGEEWNENHQGTRSTPLVVGDKLYLMSGYGKIICMSCFDGSIIWMLDLVKEFGARVIEWGMTENLLNDGDVLFCAPGGTSAAVVALDRNTGKTIWKSKGTGDKSAYGSPQIIRFKGRDLMVIMMERNICCFDAATGSLLWKAGYTNINSIHANIPVFVDGFLYCASHLGDGGLMLKLAEEGGSVKEVWRSDLITPDIGGFVHLNGRLFGTGYSNRRLSSVDWYTGKELYSVRDLAPGNIIANEGLLYIYSQSGKVTLVEPRSTSFNIVSSFNVPLGSGPHWAHLTLFNKRLYVRHGTSLMVYDLSDS
jgi:outer membrane protein assembly factor BamB